MTRQTINRLELGSLAYGNECAVLIPTDGSEALTVNNTTNLAYNLREIYANPTLYMRFKEAIAIHKNWVYIGNPDFMPNTLWHLANDKNATVIEQVGIILTDVEEIACTGAATTMNVLRDPFDHTHWFAYNFDTESGDISTVPTYPPVLAGDLSTVTSRALQLEEAHPFPIADQAEPNPEFRDFWADRVQNEALHNLMLELRAKEPEITGERFFGVVATPEPETGEPFVGIYTVNDVDAVVRETPLVSLTVDGLGDFVMMVVVGGQRVFYTGVFTVDQIWAVAIGAAAWESRSR